MTKHILFTFLIAACPAILVAAPARAEAEEGPSKGEEPKVDAQIYYSEKDPHWPESKKVIDEIEKKFTTIRLERISIDTPQGYARLAEDEKSHKIQETGDLTFIFGPYAQNSKGDRRDVETYMGPMIERLLKPEVAKGRKPAKIEDYAKEIFGPTAAVESIGKRDREILYYRVYKDNQAAGYAIDAYRPISCPICGDVQFMMAVNTAFTAIDVRPVRELERRGRKLDDAEVVKFLKQFLRQLPRDDDLKVDGISGATKTSLAYEHAMNDIIGELKSQEKKNEKREIFPGHDD